MRTIKKAFLRWLSDWRAGLRRWLMSKLDAVAFSQMVDLWAEIGEQKKDNYRLKLALLDIEKLETPRAAHGVRRAVAIAREALGRGE